MMKKVILLLVVASFFSACATTNKDIDAFAFKAKAGDTVSLDKLKEQAAGYIKSLHCYGYSCDSKKAALGEHALEQLCAIADTKGVLPFLVEYDVMLLEGSEMGNPWRSPDKLYVANINKIHKALSSLPDGTTVSAEDAKTGLALIQKRLDWAKSTEATGNVLGYVPTRSGTMYEVLQEVYGPMEWLKNRVIALSPGPGK
ncbi:MAG: hypothetical protein AB7V08_14100 [Elusimicrobiales bacterium]